MEGANKLLMCFDSTSVVARSLSQVACADFSEIVAVSGFEADLVEIEIASTSVKKLSDQPREASPSVSRLRIVRNEFFADGMHSSIRKGLAALSDQANFFAVCLADQPLLTSTDHQRLIEAAREFPSAKIIAPIYAGVRGNPTLISMSLRHEILAHEDSDRGCSYLFERYPNEVYYFEMPHANRNLDVDTPELLSEARNHAKEVQDVSLS